MMHVCVCACVCAYACTCVRVCACYSSVWLSKRIIFTSDTMEIPEYALISLL